MADHLFIDGWSKAEDYTSPGTGRDNLKTPPRSRDGHGSLLQRKFEAAWAAAKDKKVAVVDGSPEGFYVEFESDKAHDLDLNKLDLKSKDNALLAVTSKDDAQIATVFIPEGQVSFFIKRFEEYLKEDTRFDKPKNMRLVDSIADLRLATIQHFWTDDAELFPKPGESIWWEIWLRSDNRKELTTFKLMAEELELTTGTGHLSFPDRTVVLCKATSSQLSKSLPMLGYFAELRKAKELPSFYLEQTSKEQKVWIANLTDRCLFADEEAPAICILDTGINRGHPYTREISRASRCSLFRPSVGYT